LKDRVIWIRVVTRVVLLAWYIVIELVRENHRVIIRVILSREFKILILALTFIPKILIVLTFTDSINDISRFFEYLWIIFQLRFLQLEINCKGCQTIAAGLMLWSNSVKLG